jgi:hypothetical protein
MIAALRPAAETHLQRNEPAATRRGRDKLHEERQRNGRTAQPEAHHSAEQDQHL